MSDICPMIFVNTERRPTSFIPHHYYQISNDLTCSDPRDAGTHPRSQRERTVHQRTWQHPIQSVRGHAGNAGGRRSWSHPESASTWSRSCLETKNVTMSKNIDKRQLPSEFGSDLSTHSISCRAGSRCHVVVAYSTRGMYGQRFSVHENHRTWQAGKLALIRLPLWKFGRASGKQAWMSGLLYGLYKRLPSSGNCQKFLVSQPASNISDG